MRKKLSTLILFVCLLGLSVFTVSCGTETVNNNDAPDYSHKETPIRETNETPTIETMTRDNMLEGGKSIGATDKRFIPGDNPVKTASALKVHVLALPGSPVLIHDDSFAILYGAGNFESGDKVVEYLAEQGVEGLKYLMIPSIDPETFEGSVEILNSIPVFYLSGFNARDSVGYMNRAYDAAAENEVFIEEQAAGALWMENDVSFEVLYPMMLDMTGIPTNSTMVIRFEKGDVSFLLTGDIDSATEKLLLDRRKIKQTDVIIATNGATLGSMSEEFLTALNPKDIIVGLKADHEEVEALPEFSKYVSELGTVVIQCNGEEYSFLMKE